jgi:hypothetical protein
MIESHFFAFVLSTRAYHRRHPLQGTLKGNPPFRRARRLWYRFSCQYKGEKMRGGTTQAPPPERGSVPNEGRN